jgi:hypothetical protein
VSRSENVTDMHDLDTACAGGDRVQMIQDTAHFQSVVNTVMNVRQLVEQLSNSPFQTSAGSSFIGGQA